MQGLSARCKFESIIIILDISFTEIEISVKYTNELLQTWNPLEIKAEFRIIKYVAI